MSVTEPDALQLQLIRLEFKVDAIAGQYAFDSRTNRGQKLGCPILEKNKYSNEKNVMGIKKKLLKFEAKGR